MPSHLDRPRTGTTAAFGLEVQLLGTPAELDAAITALHHAGRVTWNGIGQPGRRIPLTGADTGRWRAYLLLHIPTRPPTRSHPQETATTGTLPDAAPGGPA